MAVDIEDLYPHPAVTEKLRQWYKIKAQLDKLTEQEKQLRLECCTALFPEPKEGTNKGAMPAKADGSKAVVTMVYRINRTVDGPAFEAVKTVLVEKGVRVDNLVKYNPQLSVGEYKKLSGEQLAIVDTFVTAKPGLPSLDIG